MGYIEQLNDKTKRYFRILEPTFPSWLNEYINTKEMLRLQYVSVTCGTIYSKLFNRCNYSTLDHSIGVALIIWHFTHDKAQALAGLFHDIATPVFKHCIDFLNGDYENQESTEDLTRQIIQNSSEIMNLLKKDNIDIDSVCDYHIYTIADNDTPQLSADRLEYSLSNALFVYKTANETIISQLYNNIYVATNEFNEDELVFHDKTTAIRFVEMTSKLSIFYRDNETRYSMQFLADIVKKLYEDGDIKIIDLYNLKELEIIEKIKKSKYGKIYSIWENSTELATSSIKPNSSYFVNIKAKVRYINPMVKNIRAYDFSSRARELINNNLKYDMNQYLYINGIKM